MKKFVKEFKDFISRGNVINLAVGIIIGGAFNAIVNSLVKDIIMPPVSLLLGNEVSLLKWIIKAGTLDITTGTMVGEIAITYGLFIQAILNFLIIALTLFIIIKVVASLNEKAEALRKRNEPAPVEEPLSAPEPSEEVLLLREIRDSLNKK